METALNDIILIEKKIINNNLYFKRNIIYKQGNVSLKSYKYFIFISNISYNL